MTIREISNNIRNYFDNNIDEATNFLMKIKHYLLNTDISTMLEELVIFILKFGMILLFAVLLFLLFLGLKKVICYIYGRIKRWM